MRNKKIDLSWLLTGVLKPIARIYLSKHRTYRYDGKNILIPQGVFHPGLFFSTKFLLNFLLNSDLVDKRFLELGCGSGLISIIAASSGAMVTSSDINEKAVLITAENALRNQVKLTTVKSDLFDNLPLEKFDIIAINPPYYPKKVSQPEDYAWNCGQDFEYFQKLFEQLPSYITPSSIVNMVLSEHCNIDRIRAIAGRNNFVLESTAIKKFWLEKNYIFRLILC